MDGIIELYRGRETVSGFRKRKEDDFGRIKKLMMKNDEKKKKIKIWFGNMHTLGITVGEY